MDDKIVKSIKKLCVKNNINLSRLEKNVGLSQGLISKWKTTTPSLEKLIDIARYFSVSLDEVVGLKDVDDVFLELLCNNTEANKLFWHSQSEPKLDLDILPNVTYNDEIYTYSFYYTEYNNGYIIIYAFHKRSKLLTPEKLVLFIQPMKTSSAVYQNYNTKELSVLWIKILNSLNEITPVETVAEEYKQTAIEQNISEDMALNKCVLNTPEFKRMIDYYSSSDFQKILKTVNEFYNKKPETWVV